MTLGTICSRQFPRLASTAFGSVHCKATGVRPWAGMHKYSQYLYLLTSRPSSSSSGNLAPTPLSNLEYEDIAERTLESLTESFDELSERQTSCQDFDVSYAMGVLNVRLGNKPPVHGTYVINKQSPNKQIWLSSPYSGPKRYDFVQQHWIYLHDGGKLHDLLNNEFRRHFPDVADIDFSKCAYG